MRTLAKFAVCASKFRSGDGDTPSLSVSSTLFRDEGKADKVWEILINKWNSKDVLETLTNLLSQFQNTFEVISSQLSGPFHIEGQFNMLSDDLVIIKSWIC